MPAKRKPADLGTTRAQLLAAIAAISPGHIVAALEGALMATVTTRAGTVEPDHRLRVEAAKLAFAHLLGRPAEAPPPPPPEGDADDERNDLLERMRRSPALRSLMREMLAASEQPASAA